MPMERGVLLDKARAFFSKPNAAFSVTTASATSKAASTPTPDEGFKKQATEVAYEGVVGCVVYLYHLCKEVCCVVVVVGTLKLAPVFAWVPATLRWCVLVVLVLPVLLLAAQEWSTAMCVHKTQVNFSRVL
jgi:hypothetical protein